MNWKSCNDEGKHCTTVGRNTPDNFRLAKKPNGELVLRGCYSWQCAICGLSGETWHDLPTIDLPAPEQTPKPSKFCQFVAKLFSRKE